MSVRARLSVAKLGPIQPRPPRDLRGHRASFLSPEWRVMHSSRLGDAPRRDLPRSELREPDPALRMEGP